MGDYTFEPLSQTLRLCVTPEHKFGSDAFYLSDFATPRKTDQTCDLGSGCGIIPALWFRKEQTTPQKAYAVELQTQAVLQMQYSIREGGLLPERFVPVQADLRQIREKLPNAAFDVVTCNPPYKSVGAGILSDTSADQIARHETTCTIEDVCAAAAWLLKYQGRLCICQRPERLTDVLYAMRQHQIEPKRLRFVHQTPDRAPWLFLVEGRRGGKPFMNVEPPLIVEGEGGFSQEVLRIYQKERNLQ